MIAGMSNASGDGCMHSTPSPFAMLKVSGQIPIPVAIRSRDLPAHNCYQRTLAVVPPVIAVTASDHLNPLFSAFK